MNQRENLFAMAIIGILFFIFGFVTWLNGSLIPFLKVVCDLDEFEALFVTFAFYIAYTVMAFPMSYVIEKTGYKDAMVLGLAVMSAGALLFIPAAQSGSFALFLIALFVLGTGLTVLQTASNPYVVHLGPIESAAMRISIMGLLNKGAGVAAPLVFTALILSDIGISADVTEETRELLASKLVLPYIVMALILCALIALVKFSSLPELELEGSDTKAKGSVFEFPRIVLGATALFFYVGIEVIAGDTVGLYAEHLGLVNSTAMTSYVMAFMVLGYALGVALIPRYLSQEKALIYSALSGLVFLIGVVASSEKSALVSSVLWGWSGITVLPDTVTFVALLGLSNALVWPSIWPLALEGAGRHTAKASALLITAIAGGAVLPLIFGKIAEVSGDMQSTYLIGVICYAFILFYALRWHKIRSWDEL